MAARFARAEADDPKKVDKWFNRFGHSERKPTRLHFYLNDATSAVRIAEATMTKKSPTLFGAVYMIDDPSTEGPKLESPLVGRAQGLYGSAGLESLGLLMNMNLIFTSPMYNSSTLSMMGRNPPYVTYREMPIVSGIGFFRLVSGIATAKTYFLNTTSFDVVVVYNVIAMHY